MEDQTAILSGSLQADPFETQMRGYNKRQVDDYITRTNEQLAGLEARLAAALDAAERARLEVAAVREQQEQQAAAVRPAHEEVSERLSQILRLAAEEAEQERGKAEADIVERRSQADAEIEARREQAQAEADQVVAAARHEAESELGHARSEAERLLASSREEADRTLGQATEHAERLRSQAERRAAAVNGVLDQRLAAITAAHGNAVRQLTEIQEAIGGLLAAESGAGVITAAVPPVQLEELDDAASAAEPPTADSILAALDGEPVPGDDGTGPDPFDQPELEDAVNLPAGVEDRFAQALDTPAAGIAPAQVDEVELTDRASTAR